MEPPAAAESQAGSPAKQILLRFLSDLGLAFQEHTTAQFLTMEDCRRERDPSIQGVFCKNLFVRDKRKQFFLISAHEDSTVDLKDLRKKLEANRCLTFATPEELDEKLKVKPGGVTPFAALNCPCAPDVKIVLDQLIVDAALANFHPLELESTVTIAPPDLLKFLAECGFDPIIYDFSASTTPDI